MADLFDMLDWRGDLTMACQPMNPVDGLILAWATVLPFRPPVPERLGEAALSVGGRLDEETLRLARALAANPRFSRMELRRFEQKFSEAEEMQFAAMTVLTGDGRACVLYRGTDATLVGWKEDFNMAFSDEVPAQREAARYLDETAAWTNLPLRVAGHSKGGNLAVYAAAKCAPGTRARIESVWNFDGPGLNAAALDTDGFREVEPRVETWLPESSVVGILLERTDRYHVVRSSNVGPMQHAPASWQVTRDGFVLLDELSWQSLYADRTLREWLNSMTREERRQFVETLYDLVEATGARTLGEITGDWQASLWEMLNAFSSLDLRTKAAAALALGRLVRAAVRNLQE